MENNESQFKLTPARYGLKTFFVGIGVNSLKR